MVVYLVSPVNGVSIFPETIDSISETTVNFTCSSLGGLNNTFEWTSVRTEAIVSASEELTIVADAVEGGLYQCRVSNPAGDETELATLNGEKKSSTIILHHLSHALSQSSDTC